MGTITSNRKKTIRSAFRILATARFFVVMAVSCVSRMHPNKMLIGISPLFQFQYVYRRKAGKGKSASV
jgi:hypothetical protein